jgi:GH25 family lysozyme M1 (1,4-beta-N-acetylmuramidase)
MIKNFSTGKKVAIIAIVTIAIVSAIGFFVYPKLITQTTEAVSATNNKLNIQEEVAPEVKEEVIQVAKDTSVDESLGDENEEEVTFNDKKVTVPKSTVAPVNSSEDAESGKKNGGDAVDQAQANEMFQNEGTHSNGIDVSAHQGKINWAQVAASGVDFAMIRVGFRGQTSGGIYEDAYFKTNIAGATANGIKVGIYFYSTAVNENEALEEAVWVVKKISTYRITYPVVYDFEDFNAKRCANVGGAQATSNALTFLQFVQANGYEPMMYANKSDITTRMSRSSFGCKFWLAHYTTQTDYKGSFNMWQYTSKGSVPGISGNVDMNVAYFSYGTTAAPKHTHNYTEEVKNSYKAPTCTAKGSKTLRCSCGDTQTEEIAMLDHKFGNWEVVTEATVENEGTQKRVCSVCSKEENKKIDKLKPAENTTNSSNTSKPSSSDNTNTAVHTHSYVEDTSLSIKATCGTDGKKVEVCSCGDKKETTISATGNHTYSGGKCTGCGAIDPDYEEEPKSQPQTNTNANVNNGGEI